MTTITVDIDTMIRYSNSRVDLYEIYQQRNHGAISDFKSFRSFLNFGTRRAWERSQSNTDVIEWCQKNIERTWTYCDGRYYFSDESDKLAFLIRWS